MNPIAEVVIAPLTVPMNTALWLGYAGSLALWGLYQLVLLGWTRSSTQAWHVCHVLALGGATLWLTCAHSHIGGAACLTLLACIAWVGLTHRLKTSASPLVRTLLRASGVMAAISLVLAWLATTYSALPLMCTWAIGILSWALSSTAVAITQGHWGHPKKISSHQKELAKAQAALQQAQNELASQRTKDPLTGLHNRTFLTERLPELWGVAIRWKQHFAMLMVDIDHLDDINERYSRAAGDEVLRAVANVITQVIRRPSDHAIRYGDEEFLVVLPQTHAAGSAHMAERIRSAVADLAITHDGHKIEVTVSIGVTCIVPNPRTELALMLQLLDRLLHQAKAEGRNRCALQPSALAQLKPPESA